MDGGPPAVGMLRCVWFFICVGQSFARILRQVLPFRSYPKSGISYDLVASGTLVREVKILHYS